MQNNAKYTYKLPLNMQPEWKHLFRPDYRFRSVSLKVKRIKNAFVNHYGLVIKNGLLVKGCAPNLGFSKYDEGFYFKHWRLAFEQFLVCRFGKSIPYVKLNDNKKYLLIHSPWFSYYFWITECLPRILMVKDELKELTLIYPEGWKDLTFVNQSLALFPDLQTVEIPADHQVFVKNLVMPETKPWSIMFIPDHVESVRSLLLKAVKDSNIESPFGENIYISRKSATRKKFVNEEEVDATLKQFGFDSVVMEDFTFFEQIAIMQKAKNVIAITGAGTINILFMEKKGNLIDLPHKDYITKSQYKFHFFKLCNILDIGYSVLFQDRINDPNVDHYSKQNLLFDKKEVTEYITKNII